MSKDWELWSRDHYIIESGKEEQIREKIEFLLEDTLGFFVMLQENTDDDEFELYLHSDNYEDLSDEDWDILTEYGITYDNPEKTREAIFKILHIFVA